MTDANDFPTAGRKPPPAPTEPEPAETVVPAPEDDEPTTPLSTSLMADVGPTRPLTLASAPPPVSPATVDDDEPTERLGALPTVEQEWPGVGGDQSAPLAGSGRWDAGSGVERVQFGSGPVAGSGPVEAGSGVERVQFGSGPVAGSGPVEAGSGVERGQFGPGPVAGSGPVESAPAVERDQAGAESAGRSGQPDAGPGVERQRLAGESATETEQSGAVRSERSGAGVAAGSERSGAVGAVGSERSGAGVAAGAAVADSGAEPSPGGVNGGDRRADGVPEEGPAAADQPDHRDGGPQAAPKRKLTSAGALIWVLVALFGFTLVVQLRSNDGDQSLATARQEDLVRILSDLEARDSRLQGEINALENSQRQLTSGVARRQTALEEADRRAQELGLLAGTLPGQGPGLQIVLDKVKASAILNAVQELRGAGGEVMQIAGADGGAVRIVASSYFVDAEGGGIVADGQRLSGPYTLSVIGSPQTMQTALQIPGGVVASVNSGGGSVTMEARSKVEVTAVRQATTLQHARPVS